jgi:hypothetical protein
MAKAKKISKKELEEVREVLGNINGIVSQIGQLELSKTRLTKQFEEADVALKAQQQALKEKYGDVSIDLEKGVITEVAAE